MTTTTEERRERLDRYRLPITTGDGLMLGCGTLRDDVGAALPEVRAWLTELDAPPWLVLCGPPGRGKTLAAAWALVERGGRYVGARELERLRVATFGPEAERFESLMDCALLVIDDMGREEKAERFEQALLDLVDYRRRPRMRTIAIANLTRAQLEKRYTDERLWSRLAECARFRADKGPDLRRKGTL